jgi:flavodoxin
MEKVTYLSALIWLTLCCSCTSRMGSKSMNAAADTVVQNVGGHVDLGNVLIAYYSLSGKTQEAAEIIRQKTGGTLFRIETTKTYSGISVLHALDAKSELERGNLPELVGAIPDMSAYDLIIVGSPTWRHTIATPVVSFLEQCDFCGKPVAAYATNKGNTGTFFELLAQKASNARLLTGEELNNNLSGKAELSVKITMWLNRLKNELK